MLTREIQIDAYSLMDKAGEPKKGELDHLISHLSGKAVQVTDGIVPKSKKGTKGGWRREYSKEKKRFVYAMVNS